MSIDIKEYLHKKWANSDSYVKNQIVISKHARFENEEYIGYSFCITKKAALQKNFRSLLPKSFGRGFSIFKIPNVEIDDNKMSITLEKIENTGILKILADQPSSFVGIYEYNNESYIIIFAYDKESTQKFLNSNEEIDSIQIFEESCLETENKSQLFRAQLALKMCVFVSDDFEEPKLFCEINTSTLENDQKNKTDNYTVYNDLQPDNANNNIFMDSQYNIEFLDSKNVNNKGFLFESNNDCNRNEMLMFRKQFNLLTGTFYYVYDNKGCEERYGYIKNIKDTKNVFVPKLIIK